MSSYISWETPLAGSRGVMAHEINSQRVKYAERRAALPNGVEFTLESSRWNRRTCACFSRQAKFDASRLHALRVHRRVTMFALDETDTVKQSDQIFPR